MKLLISGATLLKEDNVFKVIYKDVVIFENHNRSYALCVALNKTRCENKFQKILLTTPVS